MSYSIERLDNPHTLLVTLHGDFGFVTDYTNYHHDLMEVLDNETEPVDIVIDIEEVKITLEDLFSATREGRDKRSENPFQHPNANILKIVTNNALIKASVTGFVKLGIVKRIQVFASVDAALQEPPSQRAI